MSEGLNSFSVFQELLQMSTWCTDKNVLIKNSQEFTALAISVKQKRQTLHSIMQIFQLYITALMHMVGGVLMCQKVSRSKNHDQSNLSLRYSKKIVWRKQ